MPNGQIPPGQTPAGWFPDPSGAQQLRYWDGAQWTQHVSPLASQQTQQGQQAQQAQQAQYGPQASAPQAQPNHVTTHQTPDAIQRQVAGGGYRGAGVDPNSAPLGGGTLLSEPVLVVNQKRKLIELTNQYAVFDRNGRQLGSVSEVNQNAFRKVLRFATNVDQFLKHTYEIRDMAGNTVLGLHRPGKIFKSKFQVYSPAGPIGEIVQENMIGKIRFGFLVGGQKIGGIFAENWRAWNFRIEDHTGQEVARVTKTFEGVLTTLFTTADNYVLQIHRPLQQPLMSMVVASALCIDTALKQDDRSAF